MPDGRPDFPAPPSTGFSLATCARSSGIGWAARASAHGPHSRWRMTDEEVETLFRELRWPESQL